MQIVDTSLIFKKPCVDLEANTFKSQKSEFYEAWLANFGPFFSNLGLLKARSPSNLVMNNLWCPPILPHAESEKWEENWTKTNYIRSQPVKIDNPQKVEALNHTLTSNLTEDTWKDKMLIHHHPNWYVYQHCEIGHEVTNVVAIINPNLLKVKHEHFGTCG